MEKRSGILKMVATIAVVVAMLTVGCESTSEAVDKKELLDKGGVYFWAKNDKPFTGKFIEYDGSGNILSKGNMKGGKLHGVVERYRDGKLVNTVNWVEGKRKLDIFQFTDARDGKKYSAVKIGIQTWMAENLNFSADGSWCYEGKPENCEKYGRLYNWATAMKACPAGWHLPSDDEWQALVDFAGGDKVAGGEFKAEEGWKDGGNGTNEYGFMALPGGCRDYSDGKFGYAGYGGYWWSATEINASFAYYRNMYYNDENVSSNKRLLGKSNGYSVRCLKD